MKNQSSPIFYEMKAFIKFQMRNLAYRTNGRPVQLYLIGEICQSVYSDHGIREFDQCAP